MNFREFEKFCHQNNLKIFTIHDIKILFKDFTPGYIRLKINRWKNKGYIENLKKGLYVFTDEKIDEFEIAAKLIMPSYISMETALSHYSIIPDVTAEVTSITSKNTRHFRIHHTHYHYYHIKPSLFSDYYNLQNDVFIATPEKALLDFFYFKKPDRNDQFFERLHAINLKSLNKKKIQQMSQKYPSWLKKRLQYCHHALS